MCTVRHIAGRLETILVGLGKLRTLEFAEWVAQTSALHTLSHAGGRLSGLSPSTQQPATAATILSQQLRLHHFYMTVMIASETHSNAFQCIAQPNTTFA